MMNISSSAFHHNQKIPEKFTYDGDNKNPPLSISDIPANAKSIALIVDDPDAPAGDWVHWLVWNISPHVTEIIEGAAPEGIEGTTDFGTTGWGGPCPPSGTHRYFFKAYALDTELNLPPETRKAGLEKAMDGHILDHAELVGLYERS